VPLWAERLPQLPNLFFDVIDKARRGEIQLQLPPAQLESIKQEIRAANRRSFAAIVGAALLLGASIMLALDGRAPRMLAHAPLLSWFCGILGAVILLASWPKRH